MEILWSDIYYSESWKSLLETVTLEQIRSIPLLMYIWNKEGWFKVNTAQQGPASWIPDWQGK